MAKREAADVAAVEEVRAEPGQEVVAEVREAPARADSPETRENAVHQEPAPEAQETILGTDVAIAPPAEGTMAAKRDQENVRRLEQAPPPEDEKEAPALPEGAYNSEAYRAANSGARDAFAQVVRRPGHIFRDHGGRYVNINDLSEVYDVEPGTVIPEGLFLFPVNYLVRDDERAARLRG